LFILALKRVSIISLCWSQNCVL